MELLVEPQRVLILPEKPLAVSELLEKSQRVPIPLERLFSVLELLEKPHVVLILWERLLAVLEILVKPWAALELHTLERSHSSANFVKKVFFKKRFNFTYAYTH